VVDALREKTRNEIAAAIIRANLDRSESSISPLSLAVPVSS